MDTLIKNNVESILYNFDFTERLEASETITGTPTVTSDIPSGATPLTIGSPVISSDGLKVQVRISGGTVQKTYHLSCIVTTLAPFSNTRELCGDLVIPVC